jgi:hypothetical protein
MNPLTDSPLRRRHPGAGVRVGVAALLGIVAGVVAFVFTFWQAATLIGWEVGFSW